ILVRSIAEEKASVGAKPPMIAGTGTTCCSIGTSVASGSAELASTGALTAAAGSVRLGSWGAGGATGACCALNDVARINPTARFRVVNASIDALRDYDTIARLK